jgi:predicted dehydrogenase
VLAINHQMRFIPHYVSVKQQLGTPELGTLVSIVITGSNFGLAMNASHYFELFRYLSDTRVASLQAWLEEELLANPRGPAFEDRSGRLLAWGEKGTSMYIDFSARAGHGAQLICICRNGQISVDEVSGEIRVDARKAEYRDLPTSRYCMPSDVRRPTVDAADIVRATMDVWTGLLTGTSFPDGHDGAHALRCVVAAHLSHETRRAVRLDDPALPRERIFKWA